VRMWSPRLTSCVQRIAGTLGSVRQGVLSRLQDALALVLSRIGAVAGSVAELLARRLGILCVLEKHSKSASCIFFQRDRERRIYI
jgi:hypothetical protein